MPDRRIPPPLRDPNRPDGGHPGFDEYLAAGCGRDDAWVVVADLPARDTPVHAENVLLWSALVAPDSVGTVLESEEWEAAFDSAGYPSFLLDGGEVKFETTSTARYGVDLTPFTIYRSSHGYDLPYFDLLQSFLLYHSLVDNRRGTLFRIEEDGSFTDIVRFEDVGGRRQILVERGALLDYLSAHGCVLVRYHDRRTPLPAGSPTNVHQTTMDADTHNFRYNALPADIGVPADLAYLHGKDVIRAPAFPTATHSIRAGAVRPESQYQSFIVDVDRDGHPVEETSNGGLLSSYFRDTGRTHYLTPTWFRAAVLDRYYQDRRYTVEGNIVRCLDLWSLQFDRVSDDRVQVWLGDLGSVPYREQQHWRAFNIRPPVNAAISEARRETDFGGNFAEPAHNPIYRFHRAFAAVQDATREREGRPLFRPLGAGDEHVAAGLRVPLTDDAAAFDEQVLNLAKFTADSIDIRLVEEATHIHIDRVNGPQPFDVLERYLELRGVDAVAATALVAALRAVQQLRSSGAAHRRAADYEQRAARVIAHVPSQRAFRRLLDDVTEALEALPDALRRD